MKELTSKVIDWIKETTKNTGNDKVIIEISGTKDSNIAATLCVKALGKENVFGLMMPHGKQSNLTNEYKTVDELAVEYDVVDIADAFREIGASIPEFYSSKTVMSDLAARIRMATLYAYGQTIGALPVCIDDIFRRSGGIAPLAGLTPEEVVEIGDDLAQGN